MDQIERASIILGKKSSGYVDKNTSATNSTNVTMITGEAMSDSVDGVVSVNLYGYTISDDDEQYVDIPTTVNVKKGDTVQISLVGADGTAKSMLVTGVVAGGDRMAKEIESISVYKADIKYLNANHATIQTLVSNKADIVELAANKADIVDLAAEKADIDELTAKKAEITSLATKHAEIEELAANKADILDLTAQTANITNLFSDEASISVAKIKSLWADLGKIETLVSNRLLAGDATIENVTAEQLSTINGWITSAMVKSLTADKITSGRIDTSNVKIESKDGGLVISGPTLQISDTSGTVRTQIGLDKNGDYTFVLYDASGKGVLIDADGIKPAAVPDKLIVDKMVADDANISGSKLDIDSVVESINGSSKTINMTKIYLDDKKGTLSEMFSKYDEEGGIATVNSVTKTSKSFQQSIESLQDAAIKSVTTYWVQTTDTTAPKTDDSGWSAKPVVFKQGYHIWQMQKTEYINPESKPTYSDPVEITSQDVVAVKTFYRTSASKTKLYDWLYLGDNTFLGNDTYLSDQFSAEWNEDYPDWVDGAYLWIKQQLTYTDGSTKYTDPVIDAEYTNVSSMVTTQNTRFEQTDEKIELKANQTIVDSYYSDLTGKIEQEITDRHSEIDQTARKITSKVESVSNEAIRNVSVYFKTSTSKSSYNSDGYLYLGDNTFLGDETYLTEPITSDSEWSKTQPKPIPGHYLWTKYLLTYFDEATQKNVTKEEIKLGAVESSAYNLVTNNMAAIDILDNSINLTASQVKKLNDDVYQQRAKFEVAYDEITSEVSKKVGTEEIISRINQTAEKISINANKIDLSSYATKDKTREAFRDDDSEITISSGKLTFDTNTFILNGDNVKITSNGSLMFANGKGVLNSSDNGIQFNGRGKLTGDMYDQIYFRTLDSNKKRLSQLDLGVQDDSTSILSTAELYAYRNGISQAAFDAEVHESENISGFRAFKITRTDDTIQGWPASEMYSYTNKDCSGAYIKVRNDESKNTHPTVLAWFESLYDKTKRSSANLGVSMNAKDTYTSYFSAYESSSEFGTAMCTYNPSDLTKQIGSCELWTKNSTNYSRFGIFNGSQKFNGIHVDSTNGFSLIDNGMSYAWIDKNRLIVSTGTYNGMPVISWDDHQYALSFRDNKIMVVIDGNPSGYKIWG